mgnify:CR=1 FL=1
MVSEGGGGLCDKESGVELNGVERRRGLNIPMSLEGSLEVHSVRFICASALCVGELLRQCRATNMAMWRRSYEV